MESSRQSFDVVCDDCGSETTVPFKPSGDRPVYCRDCFSKRREDRPRGGRDRGSRQSHTIECSECGKEDTVPFKPSGDRPVYCRDCFSKQRRR